MKRPKNPMTFEEHQALGRELHEMRERLLRLAVDLSNRYGDSQKYVGAAFRATKAVDTARCWMDSQLAVDWPEDFDVHVYYPSPQDQTR